MELKEFPDYEICYIHTGSPGYGEALMMMCYIGGPTHARFVYVYLPGYDRILTLCEVEVYEFTGMFFNEIYGISLQWRHNGRDGVSNHQPQHCLLNRLAFVWEFSSDRWIPRTNGQWRGKCFHLMTSSRDMEYCIKI